MVFVFSKQDKIFGISKINNGQVSFPRPINTNGNIEFITIAKLWDNGDCLVWIEQLENKYYLRYSPISSIYKEVYDNANGSIELPIQTLSFGIKDKNFQENLKNRPKKLTFSDFNSDGIEDLVILWNYTDKESLYLGMNKNQFREIIQDQKVLEGQPLVQADLDGNKTKEVILVQPTNVRLLKIDKKEKLYINQQINWKFSKLQKLILYKDQPEPKFIALTDNKLLLVKYNNSKKEFEIDGKLDLTGINYREIRVGDNDSSNKPDILIMGDGVIHLLLDQSKSLKLISRIIMNSSLNNYQYWNIFSSDLDNDKINEILLFDNKKAMFEIYRKNKNGKLMLILRHRLFERTTFLQQRNSRYEFPEEIQVGDVDGNGKPDFICILQDRIAIYLQQTEETKITKDSKNEI